MSTVLSTGRKTWIKLNGKKYTFILYITYIVCIIGDVFFFLLLLCEPLTHCLYIFKYVVCVRCVSILVHVRALIFVKFYFFILIRSLKRSNRINCNDLYWRPLFLLLIIIY